MNRQERRKLERETKQEKQEFNKNYEWFKNLSASKQRYIGYFIEKKVIENDNITAEILDDCFKAAMIEVKGLSLVDCNKIIKIANEHMEEAKNILEKDLKGEYLKMIKNESLKAEIREEAKKLLQDGAVMSRGVQNLRNRKEYNKISVKDMTILWAEAKEELKAPLASGSERSLEIVTNEPGIKINTDILKIKSIEIEGKHGTYIKSEKGVKTVLTLIKDVKELEEYKKATKEEINTNREELNNKLSEIQQDLKKLDEREKEELEKYAEIEAVFAM